MNSPMLAGTANLPSAFVGDGKCPVGKETHYTQNFNLATGQRLLGKGYYPRQETSPCGHFAMFEWADPGWEGERFPVPYNLGKAKDVPAKVASMKQGRKVRSPCKLYSNYIPTIFQLYSNYTPTIYSIFSRQLYSNYIPTIFQLYLDCTPTTPTILHARPTPLLGSTPPFTC